MSVTSNRLIQIAFSSDIEYTQEFSAVVNPNGSGQNQLIDLTAGNNTITVPTDAVAVTIIIPDPTNDAVITLKGDNADIGIILSLADPNSISLDGSATPFVLNTDVDVTVRLIFS